MLKDVDCSAFMSFYNFIWGGSGQWAQVYGLMGPVRYTSPCLSHFGTHSHAQPVADASI